MLQRNKIERRKTMKNWHMIAGLVLIAGSYYFSNKAQTAKTRKTRIRDEIASDALSLAASLVKG